MIKGIDVTVSCDTTGSMYPCLTQALKNMMMMTNKLFKDITDLRMSIIVHGDYCDAGDPYTIKILDLTNDQNKILNFIKSADRTNGGDADECYELVLNQARTEISWGDDRNKVLMIIGDANPHGVNYPDNKAHIDWKNEADLLNKAGIQVHGVHAMSGCRSGSTNFYKTIAQKTGGTYLTLDQFSDITNMIMAVCYQQDSESALDEFVTIIRDNGQLNKSMQQNIQRLTGNMISNPIGLVENEGLTPVPSGRFQVMPITETISIKDFIEENGITFEKGRTFYQLTKSEEIAQYKELIMKNRISGELFNGAQVREELGLLVQTVKGGQKEKLKPTSLSEYDVFIQSTSYTRKVAKGTSILYEVSDWL